MPARALALVAALAVAPALAGCAAQEAERPDVLATFYPLQFLASRIGAPNVSVETLVPSGVEPHEYEATTTDLVRIGEARLLVLQGAGFEAWAGQARAQAKETRVVVATDGVELREGEEHEGEAASGGEQDPHTWLSPPLFARMSENVERGLVEAFPEHAAAFRERGAALRAELGALDGEFRAGLASCATPLIITNHASFGYLAAEYGFEQHGISGLSPEAEPDPRTLQELSALAKEHNVTIIFLEELASPRVAQIVAEEANAETRVLSTLETAPEEGDYVSAMRASLRDLREAMRCT